MLDVLRKLTAPSSLDEEAAHRELVLKLVLVSTPILLSIYVIVDWMIFLPNRSSFGFGNFLWPPMVPFLIFDYWLARRGHIKLASYLFLGMLTLATAFSMFFLGTKDITMLLFAFGISLAGILVGLPGAIIIAGIDTLIFGALAWAEYQGLRPRPVAITIPGDVVAFGLILAALILVQWIFESERGRLLRRYRKQTIILRDTNQALEEANRTLDQQRVWQHEMSLARAIQASLLPRTTPDLEDFDIKGRSLPAEEVGGDFYTYLPVNEHQLGLAVGDVSGKGMASAFYMAVATSVVETQARHNPDATSLMQNVNQLLYQRMHQTGMNTALLYGLLDVPSRKLTVANAGLIAPIVCHDGHIRYLECIGLPLGAILGETYQQSSLELHPGDVVLLVSDGIIEAMNANRDLYGFARLESILQTCDASNAQLVLDSVFDSVFSFMGKVPPQDDMTLVVIKMRDHQ